MDKIVGRLLLILAVWWGSFSMGASIELRVVDTDGAPLKQAGVGRPFVLEVTVSGVAQLGQEPQLEGVKAGKLKHIGVRMMAVNGNLSSHHRYELRIDVPGTYQLGPATYEHKEQILRSNTVPIVVGKEQIGEKKSSDKTAAPILLRLHADKERVVVGERVTCRLRFYLTDSDISLRKLIEQEYPFFRRTPSRGPHKGTEKVEGVEYAYVEWEWDLYPRKEGSYVIPAYGADYDRAIERDDIWGGFGRLLGNYVETKRIYSNALSLEVGPLPPSTRSVQGIGTFFTLHLSAKPMTAKQGEGVVVSIELIGDGDLDSIIIPELCDVPKELKYYESNKIVLDPATHHAHAGKRFEYIVQGLKVGSWEIPAQSFYYYDVKQRTYKELRSESIIITITPGSNYLPPSPHDPHVAIGHDDIEDICIGPWRPATNSAGISWKVFIFLLLSPVLIALYYGGQQVLTKRAQSSYGVMRARNAFRHARVQLKQSDKKKDVGALYSIFSELFADRWQVANGTISVSLIEKRLHEAGMSAEQQAAWNRFFEELSERAFGVYKESNKKDDLFAQAEQWIDRLEKLL